MDRETRVFSNTPNTVRNPNKRIIPIDNRSILIPTLRFSFRCVLYSAICLTSTSCLRKTTFCTFGSESSSLFRSASRIPNSLIMPLYLLSRYIKRDVTTIPNIMITDIIVKIPNSQ